MGPRLGLTTSAGLAFLAGLLLKLALQPAHSALLTFYRGLSVTTLGFYLLTYYVFLIPTLLVCLVPHIAALGFLEALGVAGAVSAGLVLAANLGRIRADVRQLLGFSTLFNLGLLLVACLGLGF